MTVTIPADALASGDALSLWFYAQATDYGNDGLILEGDYAAEVEGALVDAPYGVQVGSLGPTALHPGIGAYGVRGLTLDLQGAVARNTDDRVDPRNSSLELDNRRKHGNRLLLARDVQGLTIRHATFADCSPAPHYGTAQRAREDWWGLAFSGVEDLTLDDVHITDTWSDGIYLTDHDGQPCTNVNLHGVTVMRTGRQGITINGVDGLEMDAACVVNNVARFAYDCEPSASGQARNIVLRGSATAGIGIVHIAEGHQVPIGDWTLDTMTFPHRAPRIDAKLSAPGAGIERGDFRMHDCAHTDPGAPWNPSGAEAHRAMIDLAGWAYSEVIGCTAYINPKRAAVSDGTLDSANVWTGAAA